MFWETCAAIVLVLGTWPFLGVAMFGWGLIQFFSTLFGGLAEIASSADAPWTDLLGYSILAVIDGLSSAWSVLSGAWKWAKFDHPWWAFIIGMLGLSFLSSASR
jgi:hypothetical protein